MKRLRLAGVLLVVALLASACGSGKKIDSGAGLSSTSVASSTTSDVCKTTTLTGSDVGVTPNAITVTVVADTGSPLRPGLFQGSVDGVKAWAKYINANGASRAARWS